MLPLTMFNLAAPDEPLTLPDGLDSLVYRGSIAHGMYVPSSDPTSIDDIDLMGMVIGPKSCYLGLHEWGSRGTREIKQGKYDVVLYETRKMVSLLLQGNPNVLSILWTRSTERLTCGPLLDVLIANRSLFAGKHVYNAFAGYAHAQMEKMETRDPAELREYLAVTAELKYRGKHPNHKGEKFPRPTTRSALELSMEEWSEEKLVARLRSYQKKGENIGYMGDKRKRLVLEHGYDSKNAAHLIRLLRMCCEFMATGELEIYRHDAQELLSIKRGEWPLAQIKSHATDLFEEARAARDRSSLPPTADSPAVETLLIHCLERQLFPAP